ncbi:MAG: hypothetical protein WD696_14230 [Bryobacteraceae bacterium]
MTRVVAALILLFTLASGAVGDYASAKRKIASIQADRLQPGSLVSLSAGELNAYVEQEVRGVVPEGIRNPKVHLGSGTATASGMIDFVKVGRSKGQEPGWLLSTLLEGERPVSVNARIRSSNGTAVVDVQRVEVSGVPIEGKMLEYLIDNYLRTYYPEAKVGEPFELGHRIDRLEVKPAAVGIVIRK